MVSVSHLVTIFTKSKVKKRMDFNRICGLGSTFYKNNFPFPKMKKKLRESNLICGLGGTLHVHDFLTNQKNIDWFKSNKWSRSKLWIFTKSQNFSNHMTDCNQIRGLGWINGLPVSFLMKKSNSKKLNKVSRIVIN